MAHSKSNVGRRQKSEDRRGEEAQLHLPSVKAQLHQASVMRAENLKDTTEPCMKTLQKVIKKKEKKPSLTC